ncbi:hypothetical protein Lepto7376_2585 [[Leptolyngbya] sp. PCC 7376]|uniref:hypothetical protein n=1 Tax=[Leptolyngbya] sp. PCC 7376 TaxID=111781 RepID=UPI00029ED16F|nr:hypothetical protein [[Leptolyngbya] sp. PCC 7376]AFY38857.1 hypothetical protein Lepto7376_2585 [[Leptolyngbya] sp. PCC 7376]
MKKQNTTRPPYGLCSFQDLPELYQREFLRGSAHHLSEKFLPAKVDWFTQIFMMPFWLIYALPPLTLPPALLNQLIQKPESFGRFVQTIKQQNAGEMALMLGLFALLSLLLVYCAWFAWEGSSSFVRTWQAHKLRRHGKYGFGLVLLEEGLVARLIDNIDIYNCFWLPREAITNVVWQRIREEGAKHSRWVYRTQLCYVRGHQGKQQKCWLTLKGHMFKTDDRTWGEKADRPLFDYIDGWWRSPEKSK